MEGVYETVERDGYTEIYQIPPNVDPSQYTIEEVVYIYPENQSQAPLPGSYMQPPPPAYVQAVPYNNYTYASSFPINTPPPQPVFPHMNAAPAPIPQPRPYVEQPRPMPPTCLAPYVLQPSPSMVYNLLQPPPPPPPPLPPPSIPPPLPPSGQLPVVSHPNLSFPPNSTGYYHGSQPSFPTYHTGRLQNSIVQRLSQPARETSSPSNYVKSCNLRNLTEVQTTESPRHDRDAPTEKVNYEAESQQIPSLQRSACVASDVGWHRPLQGTSTYGRQNSVSNLVPLRQDEMPSAVENSNTTPSDVEKLSIEVIAETVDETEEQMVDSTQDERSEETALEDYPRSTAKEKKEVDYSKDSYPDDSSDSGDSVPPFTAPLTPPSSISTVSRGFQNSRNSYYAPHAPPFRMVQPSMNNVQFHNARHSFPPMRRPHRFNASAPRLMYHRGNRFWLDPANVWSLVWIEPDCVPIRLLLITRLGGRESWRSSTVATIWWRTKRCVCCRSLLWRQQLFMNSFVSNFQIFIRRCCWNHLFEFMVYKWHSCVVAPFWNLYSGSVIKPNEFSTRSHTPTRKSHICIWLLIHQIWDISKWKNVSGFFTREFPNVRTSASRSCKYLFRGGLLQYLLTACVGRTTFICLRLSCLGVQMFQSI